MFLAPSLLGVLLFVLIPFADVVRRSFYSAIGGSWSGLKNYEAVWNNLAFRQAVSNTFRFLIICIPLLLVLSFVAALLIYKGDFKNGLFKTTIVLPMAIPVASIVLLWKILFDQEGLLNQLLSLFHPWNLDWIHSEASFGILVATYLWKNIGYDMLLWLAGLSTISESLYEAAEMDGAGAMEKLFYITIPEMRGTMYMIAILSLVNSFKVFRETYLIAGSYPYDSIYMLQHLFNHWFLNLDIQKMSAAAVMLTSFITGPVIIWKLTKGKVRKGDNE